LANLFAVPNFVKAPSPLGLRRLMYSVQVRDSMQYRFFDIQYIGGYWYAWYVSDPKTPNDKLEAAKELTKKGDL